MKNKLVIIGIDSLDPHVILKHRKELKNFSGLIDQSSTLISKSVFPVDTIPAWGSIYSGLHPANHGMLYVYDVFDPNLSDLNKLDMAHTRGKTFWDYASHEGYKSSIIFPTLMYPAWKMNGIMVSKSPFEKRKDWSTTERDVSYYPKNIQEKYALPDRLEDLWGGFPGKDNLKEWAELGKRMLQKEKSIGLNIYKNEKCDLFFIYFSLLDIIQHRLWRFFDNEDPTYPGQTSLSGIILDYYKIFDEILGEFIEINPEASLIVISDHGHRSRPIKTINLNEYLRKEGYLVSKKQNNKVISTIRKTVLEVITRLNIEHWAIKIVSKSQKLAKSSKSIYSSTGSINRSRSKALLSTFAGIKSYPHGGIEINRDLVSDSEYEKIVDEIINSLSNLKDSSGKEVINWIKRRNEVCPGKFSEKLYPDIIFELKVDFGVGWDVSSNIFGKSYDHSVASGGHGKAAVFLMRNINKDIEKRDIDIMDVAPTIIDLLDINWKRFDFDGKSIFS